MSKSRNYQKSRDELKSYTCHLRNKKCRVQKPFIEEVFSYTFEIYVGSERMYYEECTEETWNDNIPVYSGVYS